MSRIVASCSCYRPCRKVTLQEVEDRRTDSLSKEGEGEQQRGTRTARNSEKADFIHADKVQLSRRDPLILAAFALRPGIVSSHSTGHLVYFGRQFVERDGFSARDREWTLLPSLEIGVVISNWITPPRPPFLRLWKKVQEWGELLERSHFW